MIDWDRYPPAIKEAYDSIADRLDEINRETNLDGLKALKGLKRSLIQDGILNDFEPQSLDEIDALIERLLEKLT